MSSVISHMKNAEIATTTANPTYTLAPMRLAASPVYALGLGVPLALALPLPGAGIMVVGDNVPGTVGKFAVAFALALLYGSCSVNVNPPPPWLCWSMRAKQRSVS